MRQVVASVTLLMLIGCASREEPAYQFFGRAEALDGLAAAANSCGLTKIEARRLLPTLEPFLSVPLSAASGPSFDCLMDWFRTHPEADLSVLNPQGLN